MTREFYHDSSCLKGIDPGARAAPHAALAAKMSKPLED